MNPRYTASQRPVPLSSSGFPAAGVLRAFTILELLVVVAIIGLLAALALPNLRGLGESNAMTAATRQLLDDVGLARQRAISGRTTVAMVFITPDVIGISPQTPAETTTLKALTEGAFTHYALFAFRHVGDQPGRATPRYITDWKALPEKTIIATNWFDSLVRGLQPIGYWKFPFPFGDSDNHVLPYIAFDHTGRLVGLDPDDSAAIGRGTNYMEDISIPVARGVVVAERDANGVLLDLTAQEVPPGNSTNTYNHIRIDWLTGRAKLEREEIQ